MEDFEMRPITEGLGFHRKRSKDLKSSARESGVADEVLNRSLPKPPPDDLFDDEVKSAKSTLDDLLASLEAPKKSAEIQEDTVVSTSSDVKIHEPLPRTGEKASAKKAAAGRVSAMDIEPSRPEPLMPPAVPEKDEPIVQRPDFMFKKEQADPGVRRGGHDSPRVIRLEPTTVSLSSSILDGVIILGMSLLFLLALLMVTKVDLGIIVQSAQSELTVQMSLAILYIAVLQMYVVVSRSFFGKTLAEWTFDLQLGDDKQINRASYPFLVLWRSLVVTFTGIVLLPILSFIVRKDLTSYLTGLQLYRKKY